MIIWALAAGCAPFVFDARGVAGEDSELPDGDKIVDVDIDASNVESESNSGA